MALQLQLDQPSVSQDQSPGNIGEQLGEVRADDVGAGRLHLRDLPLVEAGQGVGTELVPDEVSVMDKALGSRVPR